MNTKRVPSSFYELSGSPVPLIRQFFLGNGNPFEDGEIVNNSALCQSLFCSSSDYTVQT